MVWGVVKIQISMVQQYSVLYLKNHLIYYLYTKISNYSNNTIKYHSMRNKLGVSGSNPRTFLIILK